MTQDKNNVNQKSKNVYQEIINNLNLLCKSDNTFEVCLFDPKVKSHNLWDNERAYGKNPIVAGWFKDIEKAASDIAKADSQVQPISIYVTLNPVSNALLGRANERLKANADRSQDTNIIQRRWIYIDLDPNRPKGISATDSEKKAAWELACKIKDYLISQGWPEPIIADSGNGYHIIFQVDLPNDEESKNLVSKCLQALAHLFDDQQVSVDTSVFNAARLIKLGGTMTRKGDNTSDRPHRRSEILSVPDDIKIVPTEKLLELASQGPEVKSNNYKKNKDQPSSSDNGQLDVASYLSHYGVETIGTKRNGNSTLYLLKNCIFDQSHTAKEAAIGQSDDGPLFYQCFHNSCQGKTWQEARQLISGNDSLAQFMIGEKSQNQKKEKSSNQNSNVHEIREDWENLDIQPWPEPDPKIYHGIAGEFAQIATENSEANPVSVLATILTRFGAEVGRGAYLPIGDQKHHPRVFTVLVGPTARSRKGTSAAPVFRLFNSISDDYKCANVSPGPLSSGEGLIWAVRDPQYRWDVDKKTKDGEWVMNDPGVEDKRLFIQDEELASALQCTKREGNTLSSIVRCAYDGRKIDPLTKTSKTSSTDSHICIITHITQYELHKVLDQAEAFNGFANRFIWLCVRRPKLVPLPPPIPQEKINYYAELFKAAILNAQNLGEIKLSNEALREWNKIYIDISQDHPGFVGVLLNRAETHVLRLAMIYALLDQSSTIEPYHLEIAQSFWDYAERSARYIFAAFEENQSEPNERKVLEVLEKGPHSTFDLYKAFSNHITKKELQQSLSTLQASGKIVQDERPTKGRPQKIFYLAKKAKKAKKAQPQGFREETFIANNEKKAKKAQPQGFTDNNDSGRHAEI